LQTITYSSRRNLVKPRLANAMSPNRKGAADLVERLLALRGLCGEVAQRGGIVRVLQEAQLDGSEEVALVAALESAWKALRGHALAVGDDRRARGQSVPLAWLPGDDDTTITGRRHRP
jgi:hypothetical protein